jgi:hypothetical protein
LGKKGVSEDWDGDFDFDDSDEYFDSIGGGGKAGLSAGNQGMKVPQAIMERQADVHGQFGHVQELTLLVEELKRLRIQANLLHIIDGPSNELWKEAEGIVNLATLDDDDNDFFTPRSPSSPTFNFEEFDEDPSPSNKTKMRSNSSTEVRRSPLSVRANPSPNTSPPGRPPKTSSAKAKSVLETIYQQRGGYDHSYVDMNIHQLQKLPFDTQSLRDLVVRAGVVTRALKDVVRRAEGVSQNHGESRRPQDPPFSQIFTQPPDDSPTFQNSNLPKSKGSNGYLGGGSSKEINENDISGRMKIMTVV